MSHSSAGMTVNQRPVPTIDEFLGRITEAIETCQVRQGDVEAERILCLATRSAYAVFFSTTTITNSLDPVSSHRLAELLQAAIGVLRIPKYLSSVNRRLQELESLESSMKSKSRRRQPAI